MIPDESRDAGNPHVRFDGRGEETWLGERLRHRRAASAARESGRRTATPSRYGKRASPRPYRVVQLRQRQVQGLQLLTLRQVFGLDVQIRRAAPAPVP